MWSLIDRSIDALECVLSVTHILLQVAAVSEREAHYFKERPDAGDGDADPLVVIKQLQSDR